VPSQAATQPTRSLSQNCVMTASYARKKKAYGKLTARTVMLLSRVDGDAGAGYPGPSPAQLHGRTA